MVDHPDSCLPVEEIARIIAMYCERQTPPADLRPQASGCP
jgi:hypothetical protein